jgi:hypothetical protein
VPTILTNAVAIAAGNGFNMALVGDISLIPPGGHIFITVHPFSQTLFSGREVVMRVMAHGTAPLHYQWQFDGTNLPGATNASLVLTNARVEDTGSYTVRVSNALGMVTSRTAILTVIDSPPVILTQPADQTVNVGDSATFQVLANGSHPLAYQWRRQGVDLSGATNAQWVLNNARVEDAGSYTVRVSNALGTVTSRTANLTVIGYEPVILTQPQDRTVTVGDSVTFQVVAAGPQPLAYQWRWQDVDLPGATNALLVLNNVRMEDAGSHTVRVSNRFGAVISSSAFLTVIYSPPVILTQPTGQMVTNGGSAVFQVVAVGSPPLAYQWRWRGVDLAGDTNATLALNNVRLGQAGNYSVRVSNAWGSTLSSNALLTVNIDRYVDVNSAHPTHPYTNWATAAATIQQAVDAASPGDAIVVTNGIYATGGRSARTNILVNRVAVDKPLAIRSVNGPKFTIIMGYQAPGTTNGDGAIRCVYLTSGASLSGFTLTNGATHGPSSPDYRDQCGGGLYCDSTNAVASNCVLAGNAAYADGGGAYAGILENCVLAGNSAWHYGGGAYAGTLSNCALAGNLAFLGGGSAYASLNNCTLTGNSAYAGGGAAASTLNNCTLTGNWAASSGGGVFNSVYPCTLNNSIIYFNTSTNGPNFSYADGANVMNHCCTTPMPTNGVGNITNAPLFVDYTNGNLRLISNSPCINAGLNTYAPLPTDLDGLPRIIGGTVDIGAYESTNGVTAKGLPWGWLVQYGLPTDGSVDTTDPDADGHNLWQEWRSGTCPTNALSVLRLLSASPTGSNITVTWQSVAGVNYFLERTTNLSFPTLFTPLETVISGQDGTTTFKDTNAVGVGSFFYRVGVIPRQ